MTDALDVDALIRDGWIYQDFPKMPMAAWEFIKEGLGEGNFHALADARYVAADDRVYGRGQLVISPAGRKALGEFLDANKDRLAAIMDARQPKADP